MQQRQQSQPGASEPAQDMQSVTDNFERSPLLQPKTGLDVAWGMTDDVLGTGYSGKHTNGSKASAYE